MRATSRFKRIIKKSRRPVLVDFYADWCQPCKELQLVLSGVKSKFKENIRILKVNVDYNPYIISQFHVKSVPTLMIFKSGNLEWVGEGLVFEPELTEIVKKYTEDCL
ncbi:MAG: thioredoxin family protein [Mangrovibacterium sp.]